MRKIFLSIALVITMFRSYADEGMWLPMLLGQQVYKDMVKKGLKLSADQLYSANKSSLKDAIVIFGNGCTGEIVSSQGLLFTNHHCGYGQIAAASTVEANYLRDGFWAADKMKEIPSKNLTVRFLAKIEDVTKRVMDVLGDATGADRTSRLQQITDVLVQQAVGADEFKNASVASMFKGNQYFLYVYDVYKDVRLVGTPPESIGKFGGDTDNWEWPRHTGDFSVFRVYMGKNGRPANYAADNVPLKPKHFLPVSIKGFKDGDFAMIWGYPGSTNRYETSYGIKLATDVNNPSLVKLRDMRLKHMYEQMKNDPATKLQLASSYAGIANYWKFYEGETKQLNKFGTYGLKQKEEEAFIKWAQTKPEYQNLFTDYAANYEAWRPYAMHRQYINEGILGSPLLAYVSTWIGLENTLAKKGATQDEISKAVKAADAARTNFIASENIMSDRNIVAGVLKRFYEDVDRTQQPTRFYADLFKEFPEGNTDQTYQKFAERLFQTTIVFKNEAWKNFVNKPDVDVIRNDPAYQVASAFVKNYSEKYGSNYSTFNTKNNELGRLYMKGIMEMNPEKVKMMYPDANFTMRVSYGAVKSYEPRDAVKYDYVTTMKGVMEKYKPGDYEFDLPQKYLDLVRAKDYGRYIDPVQKDLVVGFITSNDITGGNSGSPVINANGELIGLAFDGNYEALSHKLAFDKDLNRTINVDVRYVLWCIEKLGGAKHIVDELKLVTNAAVKK